MRHKICFLIMCYVILSLANGIFSFGDAYICYRFPTRFESFSMDMNITSTSIGSFLGEYAEDYSGSSVAGVGDVNGDGFDDILISAPSNDENGIKAGQTYLFFGKDTGWLMDTNLNSADASFLGEYAEDYSGSSVAGVGDVNGDNFDDFIIGAYNNDEGGPNSGQTYLFFGKDTGWLMDTNLNSADASFLGENGDDYSGSSISGAGDVNNDGYNDFLIGAYNNNEGGLSAGQTYLVLGKELGWSMDTDLNLVDASFWGEEESDSSGYCVAGAGDVNGDGYDDILIGAFVNNEGGSNSGQTYLIFGKASGWSMDSDLSLSNASFWGEHTNDYSGSCIAGAGDVNGDGYDDILIGAYKNYANGIDSGQTYLIFGKPSGWSMDTKLSSSDASFLGEYANDASGIKIAGVGDVNGDYFDDFIIAAPNNDEGGFGNGQIYMVYGKESGWSMDKDLNSVDASFLGERNRDQLGSWIAGVGNVNGDGLNYILVGAIYNDENGDRAGQTYLISGVGYSDPLDVYEINVKNKLGEKINNANLGEIIYLEMKGTDSNSLNIDRARINVSFNNIIHKYLTIPLVETGTSTGIYLGSFLVPYDLNYFDIIKFSAFINPSIYHSILVDYPYRPYSVSSVEIYSSLSSSKIIDKLDFGKTGYIKCIGVDANENTFDKTFLKLTSDKNPEFNITLMLNETSSSSGIFRGEFIVPNSMEFFENITLTSLENPFKKAKIMVHTPVQVRIKGPFTEVVEDQECRVAFYNFGYNPVTWTIKSNAYWLMWDEELKELHGIPRNNDVGKDLWSVAVLIEDSFGNSHSLDCKLTVINTPPGILTEPKTECFEKEEYVLDVDSDDDGQGDISWNLNTNAPFLTIDKMMGVLRGTPIEGDEGVYFINVQVQDGNEGTDNLIFNLTVFGQNDRPKIITSDITQVEQDTPFRRDYDVFDPDEGDTHNWTLRTDADWLSMENETGVLVGTPDGYDVGDWLVNITVTDQGGLNDHHEFTLKVLDVKDKPRFDDVPVDIEVLHGTDYYFDVNASDADKNDRVTYSVRTEPTSSMVIDPNTGDLRWKASYRSMPNAGIGMKVTLTASDGQLFSTYDFYITVTPTRSPSSELVFPAKGARSRSTHTLLEWSGTDPENEPLSYVLYLSDSEVNVAAKRSEDIVSNDIKDDFYNLTGLTQGKTYYWTVIPDDGCTYGKCLSGVFSFRVNSKPTVRSVEDQSAQAGEEFMVKVAGSDLDQDDTLTYRISSGPSGMMIRDSGMIVWTPKDSQVGVHTVKVTISDGYEESVLSFRIEVSEGEGSGIGLIIGVVVGILVLLIIGLLLYIFVINGKGEEEKKDEMDEEARKMLDEMEQKKREKEWEEAHIRPSEQQVVSSVPLSAEEAQAQDKGGKLKSYEELYGKPTLDRDEELSGTELKGESEDLIKGLE